MFGVRDVIKKGCFLAQWDNPEVRDADFIFFNNSSGWFNNSKALVSSSFDSTCKRIFVRHGWHHGREGDENLTLVRF